MINDLAQQRCLNHAGREAVARCPECRNYFCRECIAEHEGRVVCAPCLARLTEMREARRRRLAGVARWTGCVASLLALWGLFYLLGVGLLALPSSFHEGTVWQVELREPE